MPSIVEQPIKHKKLDSIKQWIGAHRRASYLIAGAVLIVIATAIAAVIMLQPAPEQPKMVVKKTAIIQKPKYYSPLTGEMVETEAATVMPTTAIMIENSPDARPQSGLKDAEIVYEAIAEGGVTRFLAIYQQRKPELIGPVRSVRTYYVNWLTPYDASVAHVGGSAAALNLVRNGTYRDIDQFFNSGSYWRATDRYAPHNVYTSFNKLDELNQQKGYTTSSPKQFERIDDPETSGPQDATSVSINISNPAYNSTYAYDAVSKRYLRSMAGVPHSDREAGQISAKVVIALDVAMERVFEDGYRESINTEGSGRAHIFQNGSVNEVTWHKDTIDSQIYFTGSDTKPFALARGTTWISAVPSGKGSVSWQ